MTKIIVCDKWELPILDGSGGYFKYYRRPQAGKTALCKEWLLSSVTAKVNSVTEYFGGVGVFATLVKNILNPELHNIYEFDSDCFNQLDYAFGKESNVYFGDAKETIGKEESEIAVLDFPSYTFNNFSDWQEQWIKLFEQRTLGVIWLDTAGHYLHLHRELYSELLGSKVEDLYSYHKAVSQYLHNHFGYSIGKVATASGCSYSLATETAKPEEIDFHKVGGSNGLVFVEG